MRWLCGKREVSGGAPIDSKLEKPLPYREILSPGSRNGSFPSFNSFVKMFAMKGPSLFLACELERYLFFVGGLFWLDYC